MINDFLSQSLPSEGWGLCDFVYAESRSGNSAFGNDKLKCIIHSSFLALALLLFTPHLHAQGVNTDSLNKPVLGFPSTHTLDSVSALQADSAATRRHVIDSANTSQRKEFAKVHHTRKFYWNDKKAVVIDSATGKKSFRHSPLYATLFSAALPGLGQAYNRKYWKIPIVYAGFAGLGYAVYYTATNFTGYRNAYRLQLNNMYGSYKGVDDRTTLKDYRDYFKKNMDISAICTVVWYILNLVDAAVDAHLYEWNMKEDLALRWQPAMFTGYNTSPQAAAGVRLSLRFR